jgi:hypothetical protein
MGSKPVAELHQSFSVATKPFDQSCPASPQKIHGYVPLFEEQRSDFIGFEPPPRIYRIGDLLELMPRYRTIWLYLNIRGQTSSSDTRIVSGFCTGDEMVTKIFPKLDASFNTLVQFSSRWEVDEYMRRAAFTVFVTVRGYNWLLLAPFQIAQLVQRWASESADSTDAIIRSYPTLSDAHRQIMESLASTNRLVFLSPPDVVSDEVNTNCLADLGIQWPTIHPELQQGASEGFFAPVSMLVVSPPYMENLTGVTREFDALFTDFGNSPIRVQRLKGYDDFVDFQCIPHRSLVIPFSEPNRNEESSLLFQLSQAMPYYCWPVPAQTDEEILFSMEDEQSTRPLRSHTQEHCNAPTRVSQCARDPCNV